MSRYRNRNEERKELNMNCSEEGQWIWTIPIKGNKQPIETEYSKNMTTMKEKIKDKIRINDNDYVIEKMMEKKIQR